MTIAPYETSLTAAFTAFGEWAGFMEKISPAIQQWIEAKVPLEKQRVMDRRIRRCQRICRKACLPVGRGSYNNAMIATRVKIDFADLTEALQEEITVLLEDDGPQTTEDDVLTVVRRPWSVVPKLIQLTKT